MLFGAAMVSQHTGHFSKVILDENFGFVCIVAIAPPCEAEGDTFWGHHYAILRGAITTEDDRACDHITRVG